MQALGVASLCAGIVMCIPSARAIDCADIKPVPPQNSQTTLGGAADGRIDGLFKRLIGGEAKADFNYQKAVTDILPQFPDSDRLYVWERVLFLKCQVLNEDKTLDTRVKLGEFDQLLKLYDKPPPAV